MAATNSGPMTVAQLCDHFEQRELARENTWRSHATKKVYKAYLSRWIRPHWQKHELAEVRTIQVESWLRGLPLAKSSCAKIRNLMSVLFNHACRHELFDRNPIYLVRQSAKRRKPPTVLVPSEIKALVDHLDIRERTLVLLAASTGLRQSEMFGLKWSDIDFGQMNMYVTRSIVYGVVGPCKNESSQRPVPIHPMLAEALLHWKGGAGYTQPNRLGFCEQALPRSKTDLGPGGLAEIYSSGGAEDRNREALRMAHFAAHVLDALEKRGYRVQSHAGAVTAFNSAIDVGRLHTGGHSCEACCASGGGVAVLFFQCRRRITHRRGSDCFIARAKKRAQKGRGTRPFRALNGFKGNRLTLLE